VGKHFEWLTASKNKKTGDGYNANLHIECSSLQAGFLNTENVAVKLRYCFFRKAVDCLIFSGI